MDGLKEHVNPILEFGPSLGRWTSNALQRYLWELNAPTRGFATTMVNDDATWSAETGHLRAEGPGYGFRASSAAAWTLVLQAARHGEW